MAKMSQTIKEVIQIVVFLLIVGILLFVLVIYPLGRTKEFFARPDADELNQDSLPANEFGAFAELPAIIDSFRVDTDGLTNLAALYLTPATVYQPYEPPDTTHGLMPIEPHGLAILLHDDGSDRGSMLPMAKALLGQGYAVLVYDQRTSGLSTGEYQGDGEYEAADLTEVIAYLGLRDKLIHPVFTVGYGVGADAALLVAAEPGHLDAAIAIEPYISSERWWNNAIDKHGMYWIPLRHTLLEFWYELRSGYAPTYRTVEDIAAPVCPVLVLVSQENLGDETVVAYSAGSDQVRLETLPGDPESLYTLITDLVTVPPAAGTEL